MTDGPKPDINFDLNMVPEHYWKVYDALKLNGALAKALGPQRLEALARLIRELSENAYHHGQVTSPGKLSGHRSFLTFELRFGGSAFDSKEEAVSRNTGGLYTSNVMLNQAGGSWNHRYEFGWNIYKISFNDAPIGNGELDDLAE